MKKTKVNGEWIAIWILTLPVCLATLIYSFSYVIFRGFENYLALLGYFIGIYLAIRFGAKVKSNLVVLLFLAGAVVGYFFTNDRNLNPIPIALGAIVGGSVGILIVNWRNIAFLLGFRKK